MTGQQLKNSILQMAVQGKLVPQDPNDEPASVLLERIRKEKEQLIKDGKIKKEKNPSYIFRGADNLPYEKVGKNEPVCIADEVPFDVPDSWEWCRLKDVAFVNGGFAFKSVNFSNEGTRVIRISDFNENGFINTKIVRHRYDDSMESFLLQEKNILLCMTGGTVGKSYFITTLDEPMMTNQRVATIKIFGALEEYINLVILSPITQKIINDSKNSTNDNISMDTINGFLIPLPPKEEQVRLVKQFELIKSFIKLYGIFENKLEVLNGSFPELLKKSILQEAVQGKLVPQDPNDEPASVLLERIRAEKQRLIKEGKIKKDKHESVIFRRDNSHYEKLDGIERCIDDEIPFEIPDTWEWVRLSNVFSVINGDRGKNYPAKSTLSKTGIPFISALNLDGKTVVEDDNLLCLSDEQFNKLGNGKLEKDDVVVCIRGSLGKHGRYPFEKGAIASSLVILRPHMNIPLLSDFIMMYLDSPVFFSEIKKYDNGTAQPNLAAKSLEMFFVPLPPIEEQYRIVEKQQELFDKITLI